MRRENEKKLSLEKFFKSLSYISRYASPYDHRAYANLFAISVEARVSRRWRNFARRMEKKKRSKRSATKASFGVAKSFTEAREYAPSSEAETRGENKHDWPSCDNNDVSRHIRNHGEGLTNRFESSYIRCLNSHWMFEYSLSIHVLTIKTN